MLSNNIKLTKESFFFKLWRFIRTKWWDFFECILSFKYYRSFKIPLVNHLTIGLRVIGEQKTILPHPIGMVIGQGVSLGKNCTIFQNVTIGVRNYDCTDYPNIGNNVKIYAGAIIIGGVNIGDDVVIGAGCIVTRDVPENKIAVGSPMRIVNKKEGVNY